MFSFCMWNYTELGGVLQVEQPAKAVPNVSIYYNSVCVSKLSIAFGQQFLVWAISDLVGWYFLPALKKSSKYIQINLFHKKS